MVKYYEEGTEQILLALTFLGVMYLVFKNVKMPVRLRIDKVEGLNEANPHGLRFKTVADSQTHRGWNNH